MKFKAIMSLFVTSAVITFFSLFSANAQMVAPGKGKYGGTLTLAIPYDVKSLDARYLPGSGGEGFGQQALYDRMLQYSSAGAKEVIPMLAESWKQVDDKTWLVHIRKGVKFHNGKELTGLDVWKNMDWKLNKNKYREAKGWRPPRVGTVFDPVKSIELVDEYTLKFVLKMPFSPFPNWNLNWSVQGVIDPDIVEQYGRQATLHPVGTGPFKFVKWVAGDHFILDKFEDYWGEKAYLDKLVFRIIPDSQTRIIALQAGEVDIAVDLPLSAIPILEKDPNINYFTVEDSTRIRGGVVWFNVRRWPMNDLKFRQAAVMGADWANIAKAVFPKGSFISRRTFLKGSWAQNPEAEKLLTSYNPQKAKELIAQIQRESGKPIPEIEAIVQNIPIPSSITQIAAQQLKDVGINIKVKVLDANVLRDTYRRNPQCPWDIMYSNIKGAGIDPYTGFMEFWSKAKAAADGKNISGYVNPKLDELVEKGVSTSNREIRKKIYQELEEIALRELVAVPFCSLPRLVGYRKTVHDLRPHDSYFIHLHTPWANVWKEKQ